MPGWLVIPSQRMPCCLQFTFSSVYAIPCGTTGLGFPHLNCLQQGVWCSIPHTRLGRIHTRLPSDSPHFLRIQFDGDVDMIKRPIPTRRVIGLEGESHNGQARLVQKMNSPLVSWIWSPGNESRINASTWLRICSESFFTRCWSWTELSREITISPPSVNKYANFFIPIVSHIFTKCQMDFYCIKYFIL